MIRLLLLLAVICVSVSPGAPPDAKPAGWPMMGGSATRNPVDTATRDLDIPAKFNPEKDCLWKANLGSDTHGGPVVAAGKVFVGTNNERPRNNRDMKLVNGLPEPIDLGVLMCFDERTGRFLWQAVFDKLESGLVNDYKLMGVCSTPAVEGDRLYFVSNRCTVVCADVNGLNDGRQGAVIRGKYSSPTDADIHWEFDMMKELNVFPHNMAQCSPLVVGDLVFVCTSNGVDEGHFNVPSPDAPSFIALNKKTGQLVWKDNSPGKNILHGQWSSPAYTEDPVPQVIFAGGDGWIRAFDPPTGKLLWKFDGNPKDSVYVLGGMGDKCDFLAAACINKGRLYIAVGQDPEHSDGIGRLWCIDIRKATENGRKRDDRDVSPELLLTFEKSKEYGEKPKVTTKPNPGSASVWCYTGIEAFPFAVRDFTFGRTMNTACVVDDVLYLGELSGYIHCLDARTGKQFWRFDTKTTMWFSGPHYADGKVFIANDNGDLYVWKHVKEPATIPDFNPNAPNRQAARVFRIAQNKNIAGNYLRAKINFDAPIRTAPCTANGVLYVATERTLYALGKRAK